MKSTLKRESKELEVVEREAIVTSDGSRVKWGGLKPTCWAYGDATPLTALRGGKTSLWC